MPSSSSTGQSNSQDTIPPAAVLSAMPPTPNPSSFSLTLILAATPSLGIGKAGGLPWPQLKKEMGYFARVTKRVSSQPDAPEGIKRRNAVVMGRKTWDSIPPKFRPLKDRLNVVITRKPNEFSIPENERRDVEGPIVASGIADALSQLHTPSDSNLQIDRVFVIGGASIYKAALELPQANKVLLTKIKSEYECDTFFPVNLDGEKGWKKVEKKKLEEYVGEEVQGEVEEGEVRFEFCLYEKAS